MIELGAMVAVALVFFGVGVFIDSAIIVGIMLGSFFLGLSWLWAEHLWHRRQERRRNDEPSMPRAVARWRR